MLHIGHILVADQLSVFLHTKRLNLIFILSSLSLCSKADNRYAADMSPIGKVETSQTKVSELV